MFKQIHIYILLILLFFIELVSGKDSASAANYNYHILQKNKPFSEQIVREHTIYEIKYDFDLNGGTVYIPAECVLKFEGGHLLNGKLIFNNTVIESHYKEIFNQISVGGSMANQEVWLSWWTLGYNKNVNDAIIINQIIEAIDNCIFYYDIQKDIYVGSNNNDGKVEETVLLVGKKNLMVIQPTEYYTILRGRSRKGEVIRCANNKNISINGLKVDGANYNFNQTGENGIGVTDNEKVLIENCIIKNCFSDCNDKLAGGRLLDNGYPEWGSGGKGIQTEGTKENTQITIRNNSIKNCYIGISNKASNRENIIIDGNYIDSCYMSLILLRLSPNISMNVNVDNTIINNNTGDVGVICMGNASNVCISNTQVIGVDPVKSILRGCFSYSNIQLTVNQPCMCLIDAALYRDNPEGKDAICNYVKIISDQICENIINTSDVIPKKNGSMYANYVGGEFDITLSSMVKKTPIVIPYENNTTLFNVWNGTSRVRGSMKLINKKK